MLSTHRFNTLDSFRGLIALSILALHTPLVLGVPSVLFHHSSLLVQFFFVLSGFALMHAYGARLSSALQLGRFLATRSFRVFPPHLFLLGLFLALDWLLPQMVGNAPNLFANLFLLQAWLPGADGLSVNPATASLSLGFYLSLAFGLVLLALPRGRMVACGLLLALILWGLVNGVDGFRRTLFLGVGAFCLGALIYSLYLKLRLLPLSQRASTTLEITAVLLLVLILDSSYAYRDLFALAMFALALCMFAFESGFLSRLLVCSPFRYLGRLAFSLYLSHLFVILALANLAPLVLPQGRSPMSDALLPLTLLVVFALSALTYHGIERPGIALGQRLLALARTTRAEKAPAVSR